MKSLPGDESARFRLSAGRRLLLCVAVAVAIFPSRSLAAGAAPSLAEVSRMVSADRLGPSEAAGVVRWYASVGMRVEAALFLEKRVQLGDIPKAAAAPLFEEIIADQARWKDGDRLVALCEIALRNGAATASIWYAYGTGLRSSGRLAESLAAFGRIGQEGPFYPYAAFAIGQVAAEQGNDEAARDAFRRAGNLLDNSSASTASLGPRLLRSQAELLLSTGFPSEALPLFETLARTEDDPLVRFGSAVADGERAGGDEELSAESVARLPIREKVLFLLMRGGLSRERGDFRAAVTDLDEADRTLAELVSSNAPPAAGLGAELEQIDRLDRQMAVHATCRNRLNESVRAGDAAAIRDDVTELLLNLLLLDRSVHRVAAEMPGGPSKVPAAHAQVLKTEEILRRIENAALDGSDVEGRIDALRKKLEVLENLAHPIRRYRLLAQLERFQSRIVEMKRELALRRIAVPTVDEEGARRLAATIEELGRFLAVLGEFREAEGEARKYIGTKFDIFRTRVGNGSGSSGSAPEWTTETLEFDGRRFAELLSRTRELQDRLRRASWAQEKRKLLRLRPVVLRQLADALVGHARTFKGRPHSERPPDGRSALERAVSLLGAGALAPRDRTEVAVNIASLLLQEDEGAEGNRRIRTHAERTMIEAVLSALDPSAVHGARKQDAFYLAALLRMEIGDEGGVAAARDFLERYPGTASADDMAVRLGHEAFSSGKEREAESFWRMASTGSSPAASLIARYMLGWSLLKRGDPAGAVREVSPALAAPSFPCEDRSPVEEAVVKLATRSLERSPAESLLSFPPVREGTCVGKTVLAELAKRHENRGDAARSSALYSALADRYPGDRDALTYERKAIQGLSAIGEEEQALLRARALVGRYGPASDWTGTLPEPMRETALEAIREILKAQADGYFDRGIRSGDKTAMTAAADLLDRFFSLERDGPPSGERERRLKWAVASLESGAEDRGLELLDELLKEEQTDSTGERAAFLFAERMLSAYERGARNADDAMRATDLLVRSSPSAKGAEAALRASSAFLKTGEYGHAARAAGAVEENPRAGRKQKLDAVLIRCEAALFRNDFGTARQLADSILTDRRGEVSPGTLERAKDLLLLSALKEIEAREAAGEWGEAAALLEEIGRRFADKPEAPLYLHRAVRAYRVAGDKEGASRVGLLFLERFPGRDESLEIAGIVGAFLEERKKPGEAADLYAAAADRHPRGEGAAELLFRAACMSQDRGDRDIAKKRFLAYRGRYSGAPWRTAYATLSVGLLSWMDGDGEKAIRELGAGLKRFAAGVEPGASPKLFEIAAKANVAIGEYWADRFRKTKLVLPLGRSLEAKGRSFRKALAAFEQAERDAPAGVAVKASQLSGDLFVDFGDSLLSSQRPKGMNREERATYEEGLRSRAGVFFERALDRYAAALQRVEEDAGLGEFAVPVRRRIESAKTRLADRFVLGEARK